MDSSGRRAATASVLIVDGDRRVRRALGTLIAAGTRFVVAGEAEDAETAQVMAARHAPALALVALQLPTTLAGCALIRTLRTDHGIRVLALSTQEALRPAATAAGASGFLLKTSTPDEVIAAVAALYPGVTTVPLSIRLVGD